MSKVSAAEQPDHFGPKVQDYLKSFKSGGELSNQSAERAPVPAGPRLKKQLRMPSI